MLFCVECDIIVLEPATLYYIYSIMFMIYISIQYLYISIYI